MPWAEMGSSMVSTALQMSVPIAFDTGLKSSEWIWLITWSSFFLELGGEWEHCNCSHHLSGKRRNLSPFLKQCLSSSSWPPAGWWATRGLMEAEQQREWPRPRWRQRRAINIPGMLPSRSASCTQAAHCKTGAWVLFPVCTGADRRNCTILQARPKVNCGMIGSKAIFHTCWKSDTTQGRGL